MSSSTVIDSLSDAWLRTRSLLLSGFDPGRWLKYGFVAMLGSAAGYSGGALGHSPPLGPSGSGFGGDTDWGSFDSVGLETFGRIFGAVQWIFENVAALLLLGLGLLLIWIVLAFVFLYIKSVFRFIFVECVAADREPLIAEAWYRHAGRGLSLLGWYIVVGLLPMAVMVLALAPVVASVLLMASGEALSVGLGVGTMLAVIGAGLLSLLLLAVISALTEDLLVPAMYAGNCGVIAGWRLVRNAWRGQLGNIVLFYLLKFVLGIGAGIVAGIVGLFSLLLLVLPAVTLGGIAALVAASGVDATLALIALAGPTVFVLTGGIVTYAYIMQVLLLPISVFFQAYSLCFVGRLDPALRTI